MQVHREINPEAIAIRSYNQQSVDIVHPITERDENGKPIINQQQLNKSAIIIGDTLVEDWPVSCFAALEAKHLEVLLEFEPEVILVGTGNQLRFPHPSCAANILAKGIGVEYMDVGAACRTYNILTAEGRQVAAALILETDQP